jgi:hypothetical protein
VGRAAPVGLAAPVRLRAFLVALAALLLALAAARDGVEASDASVDELHDAFFVGHGILSIWFCFLSGTVGNHSGSKNLLWLLLRIKSFLRINASLFYGFCGLGSKNIFGIYPRNSRREMPPNEPGVEFFQVCAKWRGMA